MSDSKLSSGSNASVDGRVPAVAGTVIAVGERAVSGGRAVDVGGTRVVVGGGDGSVVGIIVATGSLARQPMTKKEPSRTRVIALFRADILPSLSLSVEITRFRDQAFRRGSCNREESLVGEAPEKASILR